MRDRQKEEELRGGDDPSYAHLKEDLHVLIEAVGPHSTLKVAAGLAEIRKMLIPPVSCTISFFFRLHCSNCYLPDFLVFIAVWLATSSNPSLPCFSIQWNPCITDTFGDQHFVRYREVSPTQGLPVYFR